MSWAARILAASWNPPDSLICPGSSIEDIFWYIQSVSAMGITYTTDTVALPEAMPGSPVDAPDVSPPECTNTEWYEASVSSASFIAPMCASALSREESCSDTIPAASGSRSMFTSTHDSSSPTPRTQRPWFVTTTAVISASSLSCFSRDCGTRISSMLVLCSVTDAETLCEPVLSTSIVAPSWNVASPTSPCEYAGAGDAYDIAARQAATAAAAQTAAAAAARRRDASVTAALVTPAIPPTPSCATRSVQSV